MKLFKKPDWLKPEINELVYWVHLIILAMVALGTLQILFGGDMFTIKNILISVPILAISDTIAHSLLKLD